jgi:hypothetical protein
MLGVQEGYRAVVAENNQAILSTLRQHFALLDAGDIDVAGSFAMNVARKRVEVDEGKRFPADPLGINAGGTPGGVPLIETEFINRFRDQLLRKQAELSGLTGAARLPPHPETAQVAALSVPDGKAPAPAAPASEVAAR